MEVSRRTIGIGVGDGDPRALDPDERAVLRVLAADRERAFTPAELAARTDVAADRVPPVLETLVGEHLVAETDGRYYTTPEGVVTVFPDRLASLSALVTGEWFDRTEE